MKTCKTCKQEFSLDRFYWNKGHPQGKCKKCFHIQTKEWRSKNRDKTPIYSRTCGLRRRYGITIEIYNKMVKKQKNRCLICKCLPVQNGAFQNSKLHIDHCHITKKVRGLLCHLCNRGIGLFKEDPNLIKAALKYLKKHPVSVASAT